MATQTDTTPSAISQSFGVCAIARLVDGSAIVSFAISIPSETGSRLVEIRRKALERFVASAIAALDDADGDCDFEDADPTEDEPGFDRQSRQIANGFGGRGPGCSIADPGGCEHNGLEPEYGVRAIYGIDQTKGPDLGHYYRLAEAS